MRFPDFEQSRPGDLGPAIPREQLDDLFVSFDRRLGLVEIAIQPVRLIEKPEGCSVSLFAKLVDGVGNTGQLGLQGRKPLLLSLPRQYVLDVAGQIGLSFHTPAPGL